MEEKHGGVTSFRELDCAFVEDLSYVRYTTTSCLQKLLFGGANKIEIAMLGDKYYMDIRLPPAELKKAHDTILAAALGRQPSPPLKNWVGKVGQLELGPEFTTITKTVGLCSLLQTSEVITVKTSDISHLRATLPAWQHALIKAIRDTEIVTIFEAVRRLMADDIALLPVWPCAFLDDATTAILLTIKALTSILQFLIIFFFRKTALVFGGPGPAKQVSFHPDEHPEALLRSVASHVTTAQKTFYWPTVGAPPAAGAGNAMISGAAKQLQMQQMAMATPAEMMLHPGMVPAQVDPIVMQQQLMQRAAQQQIQQQQMAMALMTKQDPSMSGLMGSASARSDPGTVDMIKTTQPDQVVVNIVREPSLNSSPPPNSALETAAAAASVVTIRAAAPAPKPKVAPLPAGWREETTDDGEVYYSNIYTDETQWDRPTSPARKPPPKSTPARLPPGWREETTEDGQVYYENVAKGETSWDRPT